MNSIKYRDNTGSGRDYNLRGAKPAAPHKTDGRSDPATRKAEEVALHQAIVDGMNAKAQKQQKLREERSAIAGAQAAMAVALEQNPTGSFTLPDGTKVIR